MALRIALWKAYASKFNLKLCVALCNAIWMSYAKKTKKIHHSKFDLLKYFLHMRPAKIPAGMKWLI